MNYRIVGVLYSSVAEEPFDSANILKYLDFSQIVKLNFEGVIIRKSGINRLYIVTISLTNENETQIGYEECTTLLYNYTGFQLSLQNLPVIILTNGVDTEGDGLFDYLAVEVEIEITSGGNYPIEGWLYDQNGKDIGSDIDL